MRIAVFHDLPSGGAKRTLYEGLKRLSPRHVVDIYSLTTADHTFCDPGPFARRQRLFAFSPPKLFGSPLGRLNRFERWRGLRRLRRLAACIAREIDASGYDVVFAQPSMWSQAPLLLPYLKTPSVYYCHEPPRHLYELSYRGSSEPGSWRRTLDRIDPFIPLHRSTSRRLDWDATRAATTVLVNSDFMRRWVRGIYGIDPVVCYHGVDTSLFRPLPLTGQPNYFLSVGAIQREKGFDFLIESLGKLRNGRRPPLRLVANVEIAAERQRLEMLACRHGVTLVVEVGIADEDLVHRYNEAALVAYAPHNEPFGLVPLEAMACGAPVVAVAEGGVRESVVNGVTGLLVGRDHDRFAEAIASLMSSQALRSGYGQHGLELARTRWTWESAVEALEGHLREAASCAVGGR